MERCHQSIGLIRDTHLKLMNLYKDLTEKIPEVSYFQAIVSYSWVNDVVLRMYKMVFHSEIYTCSNCLSLGVYHFPQSDLFISTYNKRLRKSGSQGTVLSPSISPESKLGLSTRMICNTSTPFHEKSNNIFILDSKNRWSHSAPGTVFMQDNCFPKILIRWILKFPPPFHEKSNIHLF